MHIQPISALKDNYIWTIINDHHKAIIVDPGSANEVLHFLKEKQLELIAILITHHHYDHTDGILAIKSRYPEVQVYGSKLKQIAGVNHLVSEGNEIEFDDFDLRLSVLEIPGHTLSHIAYYGNGVLFSGDTLFSAGCGRLFEGTPQQMVASLQKMAHLGDDTAIYCGHEYTLNNLRFAELVEPHNQQIQQRKAEVKALIDKHLPSLPSQLAMEKATNPFLRLDSKEVISSATKYANKPLQDPIEVFTCLRKWKDVF